MLKSLAKFSSLVLLGNLLAVRVQASEWGKDDEKLQFRGSDIKGIAISYFGNEYDPNYDYTGLIFYDIGSCTRREAGVCGQMKNGYVVIYKNEVLNTVKNEENLNSMGAAALKKFFKKLSVKQAAKLITERGLKVAMFEVNEGATCKRLSDKIMRTSVQNSPFMNAFEYGLLDTIRDLWVESGNGKIYKEMPKLQKAIDERAEAILDVIDSYNLDGANKFKQEYAPSAVVTDNKEDEKDYDESGKDYDENGKDYDESGKDYDESGKDYDENGKDYNENGKDYDENGKDYNENEVDYDESGSDYSEKDDYKEI